MTRRILQGLAVAMLLIASFGSAGGVLALSNCASYITVQWGDTLSGIAALCGTTVDAIRSANPGLGWWIYAGQVLYIPTGTPSGPISNPTYNTYIVQSGDTLGKIARRAGTSLSAILAVNPQIFNPSIIYVGQVINLPAGVKPPQPPGNPPAPCNCAPPPGDSLSTLRITYRGGMYIRSQPGATILSSALYKETVYYLPGSVFTDKKWKVWVKVKLYPPVKGYTTGWLLVKDQFGTYFTDPHIDPDP